MKTEREINKYKRDAEDYISLCQAINVGGMFDKDIADANAVLEFIDFILENPDKK